MAGRKRKPTAVHLTQGTYRKDRHAPPVNLRPGRPEEPNAPLLVLQLWRQLADHMELLGTLQVVHGPALLATAQAGDEVRRLTLQIEQDGGETYESAKTGRIFAHPGAQLRNNAWQRYMRGLAELGLTPASQSKVGQADQRPDDPAERFFQ